MNAHQRRKYLKPLKPLVKQAIATYKLVGMPLRAANLQEMVDAGEWLGAIEIAQEINRGDIPDDDLRAPQNPRPWGKSWFGQNYSQVEQCINRYMREELKSYITGKEATGVILDEFTSLCSPTDLDHALDAHASGLRLQRSWDWQNIRPDQSVRTTLDCLKSQTQGVGLGTEVPAALDVAERLQKVRP